MFGINRKPSIQSPQDALLVKLWMRRLSAAEKHAKDINARKQRARKVYKGETNPDFGKKRDLDDPRDYRSAYYPTIAWEHAELAIAELAGDVPEIDASPRQDTEEGDDKAAAAEKVSRYYNERDEFPRTFRTAMRTGVIDGGCPVKTVGKVTEEGDWLVTSFPIDFEDFLPEPGPTDTRQMSWCIHRWRATYDELCAVLDDDDEPFYKNLDQLMPSSAGGSDSDRQKRGETDEAFHARTLGMHTIYECWTGFGCVAIANKKVVIRNEGTIDEPVFEHREIPIDMVRIIEDLDNLDGVSLMLQIDDMQEVYWKFVNELINAITLATQPPMLIDEDADANAADYDVYPNARIPARNGEQTVKVMSDIANLSPYNMQALISMVRDQIERATGMNSTVAGTSNASSATQSASNLAQSKNRVQFEIDTSDDDWMRVMRKRFRVIKQYADPMLISRITGGVHLDFGHDEIEFSTKLMGERALREQRLNELMTVWNAIVPLIIPGTIEFGHVERMLKEITDASKVGDIGATSKSPEQVTIDQGAAQLQVEAGQQQLQMQGQQQMMAMQAQLAPPAPEPQPAAPAPTPQGDIHVNVGGQ